MYVCTKEKHAEVSKRNEKFVSVVKTLGRFEITAGKINFASCNIETKSQRPRRDFGGKVEERVKKSLLTSRGSISERGRSTIDNATFSREKARPKFFERRPKGRGIIDLALRKKNPPICLSSFSCSLPLLSSFLSPFYISHSILLSFSLWRADEAGFPWTQSFLPT